MSKYQEACKIADEFEGAALPSFAVIFLPDGDWADADEVVTRRSHALGKGYPHSAVVPLKRERVVDGVAVEGDVLLEKYFKTRDAANAFVQWFCHKMPITWANINLMHSKWNSRPKYEYQYLTAEDTYSFKRDNPDDPLQCKIIREAWAK